MKKTALLACVAVLLGGCGTPGLLQNTDGRIAEAQRDMRGLEAAQPFLPPMVEKSAGAWFTQRSVVVDEVDVLPVRFERDASFSTGKALPLSLMAEQIAKEQGIVIRLAPDIFNVAAAKPGNGAMPIMPTTGLSSPYPPVAPAPLSNALADEPRAQVNYSGSLRGLLDAVASRTSTNWSYRNGTVEFSRLITRTFQIKTMPGVSSYSAKVGKSSQSSTGGNAGAGGAAVLNFGSDSSVSMSSVMKYWDRLGDTVNSMLSPLGKAVSSEMTSSITVTDSAEVVGRVARYIDGENAVLGRQVSLSVQVFSVSLNEKSSAGIDWRLVYRAAQSGWGSTFTQAAKGSTDDAVFGVTMDSGQFSGSRILLQALSKQGRVSTVVNTNVVTLNNQPAPVAVTQNQGYLARITATPGVGGSAPSVGMEPGVISTGFVMNLLPTLLDNSSVMLQVQIDLSELRDLQKVTSGDNSIQTPITSSVQTMQRASLKSGQTLILSGFRQSKSQAERNGIIAYQGGTKAASQYDDEIIVVISPQLTEGV
ncbi:PilN family type IVB pilus formation outer membrane protein [Chromobacterium sp. IIBBL 290-4]|uniref:PilN family type IVB pilus formation outer membrane protein n=1 Tax=Chromobacterium sp. IIBBL 290-4 TaxID=2953890 RepID=UPI0020B697CA|nr:PilN family type IVB pilus formation outer membrane protein [Chromobacterium sp. IIBBL 290-4]UTH74138.1 PilN family type IVB pilus formation outer membrane protein [Chromobacterium sp. IIBBL 290-4]